MAQSFYCGASSSDFSLFFFFELHRLKSSEIGEAWISNAAKSINIAEYSSVSNASSNQIKALNLSSVPGIPSKEIRKPSSLVFDVVECRSDLLIQLEGIKRTRDTASYLLFANGALCLLDELTGCLAK
ncbi:hypothetical protein Cni_G03457 [Canna indica]|uniref:Uncharacterized protein n=1 Tax=Canna indica TaxID=4628 RepID=A0AAQ3JRM1_9LILI|nr:hypothetical protein Cni_G03457 [Canna indica]